MNLIPIVLTGVSIAYMYYISNGGSDFVIHLVDLISCTLALILVLIAILLVIKDRKNIKSIKSLLLIGIVVAYICMLILSKPNYRLFLANDYLRRLYTTSMSIGLLFMLQINLFVNLISNDIKGEKKSNGK